MITAASVVAAIDYLEYVAAWCEIPIEDRPRYRVKRAGRFGSWLAVELLPMIGS